MHVVMERRGGGKVGVSVGVSAARKGEEHLSWSPLQDLWPAALSLGTTHTSRRGEHYTNCRTSVTYQSPLYVYTQ